MPYQLAPAANALDITECQYGSANAVAMVGNAVQPTVQCSRFTSCIGVIGASANAASAIAIHLVAVDADGNIFGVADVPTVTAQMAGFGHDVQIIGQVEFWQTDLLAAYNALVQALGNPPVSNQGDGIYGAGFNKVGQLVVLHQP